MILLAARGPNCRGPLTVGGFHDRRGPLCFAQPAQQIFTIMIIVNMPTNKMDRLCDDFNSANSYI